MSRFTATDLVLALLFEHFKGSGNDATAGSAEEKATSSGGGFRTDDLGRPVSLGVGRTGPFPSVRPAQ